MRERQLQVLQPINANTPSMVRVHEFSNQMEVYEVPPTLQVRRVDGILLLEHKQRLYLGEPVPIGALPPREIVEANLGMDSADEATVVVIE